MNKHELLKQLGFSDEYLERLRTAERNELYISQSPELEFVTRTIDITDMIIEGSMNSFSTGIVVMIK